MYTLRLGAIYGAKGPLFSQSYVPSYFRADVFEFLVLVELLDVVSGYSVDDLVLCAALVMPMVKYLC